MTVYVPDGHGGLKPVAVAQTIAPMSAVGRLEVEPVRLVVPVGAAQLVPVRVSAGGGQVTSGLSAQMSTGSSGAWQPLEVIDGVAYLRVAPSTPRGSYHVTVRHDSGQQMAAGMISVA